MIVFVEDTFDSAHFLPNVPDDHKCRNMHGHTYHIRLEISGRVDPRTGWVKDYTEIKARWADVKAKLDHRVLNDIPGLENSTCENLAVYVWRQLEITLPLHQVEIRETANCGVRYSPQIDVLPLFGKAF